MTNVILHKDFIEEECGRCGVIFMITDRFQKGLRQNKNVFYCPNGHGMSYTKSTSESLREELQKAQRESYLKDQEIFNLNRQIKGIKKNAKKKKTDAEK